MELCRAGNFSSCKVHESLDIKVEPLEVVYEILGTFQTNIIRLNRIYSRLVE